MGKQTIDMVKTSSQLSPEQIERFYKLWFGLLSWINEQYKLIPKLIGKDFREGIGKEAAGKIADYIWNHPNVFNEYSTTGQLGEKETEIIRAWKEHHLKGKFYVVKYLRNGAVFLTTGKEEKPYLVKGLISNFEEMWPEQALPQLIETVLLPFEDVITTCGLYYGSRIYFGRNISRDIYEAFEEAELTYGLITSLPPMVSSSNLSSINKNHLVRQLAIKMKTNKRLTKRWVEAVFEEIYRSLENRKTVSLENFGTFYIDERPSGKIFKFNPSQKMRRMLGWSSSSRRIK